MKKAASDFYPKTLKELRTFDYYDLKKLMKYEDSFFHAAIKLCDEMVTDFIRIQKDIALELYKEGESSKSEYEAIVAVESIDDLLNCESFCGDYEDNRWEIANILVEDFIYDKRYKCK